MKKNFNRSMVASQKSQSTVSENEVLITVKFKSLIKVVVKNLRTASRNRQNSNRYWQDMKVDPL